ncbi:MAG TPA: B12-binding domain-containing radical SAM protein, partial [Candidatus Wunengus sp. YC61]|uniref:B12-binding domain-containing radical SAM protein n=1 Tax=Candidatus Wunengus sp. YC61 TaxID=3367698 RepID=UPI004025BD4B
DFKHNLERPVIEDINILPFPAYHLMPMDKYHTALGSAKRVPAMSIFATRGCPGRCTFCYSGTLGKKIRQRSPENIVEEIELLMNKYKIREVSFYDDTFSAFKNNVIMFCELIRKKNIDLTWSCMSRIDYVNEEVLKEMKASGCHQICYGVESADENVLRNIKKRISLEKVKMAVETTKKAGIDVRLSFMLGNPGDTIESIEKTIKFAIDLDPDLLQFNITTPYPGTEMFAWAKNNGYLKTEDWSKYDLYNCVMELPTVSSQDVERYYKIAYKRFFLRPKFIMKRLLKIRSFYDVKIAYKSCASIFLTAIGH